MKEAKTLIEKLTLLPDSDTNKTEYLKNSREAESYFKKLAVQ